VSSSPTLELAARRQLISLSEVLQKLERTNFRIDPELVQEALRQDAQRLELERSRNQRKS
jgi:hypothetical protein